MEDKFKEALEDVSEALKFENWLRFYFIEEKEDGLYINIPEERLKEIQKKYGTLFELADKLNNDTIDQAKSTSEVCSFVWRTYDSAKYDLGLVTSVFNSKEMQLEMHLFYLWVQGHEGQLDGEFMDFDRWQELFEAWKADEKVKEYALSLSKASPPDPGEDRTVH